MHYRRASEQVIGKILDDEAVIINLETGIYFGLDGIAAKLWELLESGQSVAAIRAALKQRFPTAGDVDQDLDRFIDDLCARGLLAAADGDGTAAPQDGIAWPEPYVPPVMTSYDDVAEMVALDPPLPELSHHMIDQSRQAR